MNVNMNWKDTTSYSRDNKERKPTTWTTEIGGLRITVTSGHIYYPDKWVMHCFECGMDTVPLDAVSAETAQRMAVERVREKVRVWHEALQSAERPVSPTPQPTDLPGEASCSASWVSIERPPTSAGRYIVGNTSHGYTAQARWMPRKAEWKFPSAQLTFTPDVWTVFPSPAK